MNQIHITQYDPQYKDQLIRCIKNLRDDDGAYDEDFDLSEAGIKNNYDAIMLDLKNGGAVFIAHKENNIVGFMSLALSTKNDKVLTGNTRAVFVTDIFVDKSYRGSGIGSSLLQKADDFALENNIKYIKLGVYRNNALARQLYARLGFTDYDITMLKTLN